MRVRFEPIGAEIDCAADESILDAAFRHGLNLAHGCREGQCSACKCFLLEGDVALGRHSSFALSDTEFANGYALMCRSHPSTDLVVELLHHDPDALTLEHPIRHGVATVTALEALTPEIVRLVLDVPGGFDFTPGQYVDLHVPGTTDARRSFSMANLPDGRTIELLIRRYPGGRISGMLGAEIAPGTTLEFTGPYGTLRLREGDGPILMAAGGSGMAPILALLRRLAADHSARPITFFYGARAEEDLILGDVIAELGTSLAGLRYVPVTGRYVHEAVADHFSETDSHPQLEAYICGPPPMLDALQDLFERAECPDPQRIFQDRFTTSADAAAATAGAPPDAASEREFGWFEPQGGRATVYEEVTIDTQPSTERHLVRGWLLSFEDGRGTWDPRSTALRSSDWFAFRDPGGQWERNYYQDGSARERELEEAMREAVAAGLLEDLDARWLALLRDSLQVPAFIEHGLWFALATAGRDCLSDSVATCVCLQAAMKQRSAQAIVLQAMDLEPHCGELSISAAREAFLSAPEWQPSRRYLERLAATRDWGEVIVAANLVLEPLVGTLLRREVGIRAAAACGDPVTPTLARAADHEWEWARAWSTALSRFLLDDPEHGARNRTTIEGWIASWLPEALEALSALAPLADRIPRGFDATRSARRVRAGAADVLRDAGLGELVSLLGGEATGTAPARVRRVRPREESRRRAPEVATGMSPPPQDGDPGSQDFVGLVIARSAEGDALAAALRRREDVEVLEQPAFWEVRARDRLVIPYADVAGELGYELDAYSIQRELTTHYGRLVAGDDALMLFADPTEALSYLMA
jgi:ferredoxin-NADP reductase/ferredoxin